MMRSQIDTSVYRTGSRPRMSIGDAVSGIKGITDLVQSSKMRKEAAKEADDNEYLNATFGKNLSGWDGQDRTDFQKRASVAMNEVLDNRPALYSKVVPEIEKTIEATRKEEKYNAEQLMKEEELKKAEFDTNISQQDALKKGYENRLTFSNQLAEQFTTPVVDENDYNNRKNNLDIMGVPTTLPSYQEYAVNPDGFVNRVMVEKADNEKKLEAAKLKSEQIGAETKGIEKDIKQKDLDTYDKRINAEINRKNRVGTGGSDGNIDTGGLPMIQYLAAAEFAKKKYGARKYMQMMPLLTQAIKESPESTLDDVADQIRYAGQSENFTGPARRAMQRLYSGKSGKTAEVAYDIFDDIISTGDSKETIDFLKEEAIQSAPAAQQSQLYGKDRTIEFIDEIKNDLTEYEKNGGDTGVFSGTSEDIARKIGRVRDEELRVIANKIKTAVMTHRKNMSGVAFSKEEGKEYADIFPNTRFTNKLNMATIRALDETFRGDLDHFYKRRLGIKAYDELMGAAKNPMPVESPEVTALPEVGTVEDGYRFKGGDPTDSNNWEQVQ